MRPTLCEDALRLGRYTPSPKHFRRTASVRISSSSFVEPDSRT
jgi:hypothetical protein